MKGRHQGGGGKRHQQHRGDSKRIVDMFIVAEPGQVMYWDDLVGGALGTQEVARATSVG